MLAPALLRSLRWPTLRMPSSPDGLAPAFVWGAWGLMTFLALRLVAVFGVQLPFDDEWCNIQILTGDTPLTLGYLWSFHNEHRIPLPRLIYFSLMWLTHCDFRAAMYANAAAMSVASMLLLRAVGRLRGSTWWSDAFIPLILLNASHADNLLWGFQLPFSLGTLLACFVLSIIIESPNGPHGWRLAAVGLSLIALTLCGANGVAFVPALAAWLTWLGWRRWREANLRAATPCFLWTAFGIAAAAGYFIGYVKPAYHAPAGSLAEIGRAALQLIATGAGTAASMENPVSPHPWKLLGGTILAAAIIASLLLLKRGVAGDRRAMGLLFFAAASLCLTAGMAYGRSGMGPYAALAPRYVMLGTPLLICIYAAWTVCLGFAAARLVQFVMLAGCLLLIWPNSQSGYAFAAHRSAMLNSALIEIRRGVPKPFAVDRILALSTHPSLLPYHVMDIESLQRKQIGAFAKIAPAGQFVEREVPVTMEARGGRTIDGTFTADGPAAEIVFRLPEPMKIAGLRWEYELASPNGYRAEMILNWTGNTGTREMIYPLHCLGKPTSSHVWIDDTICEFRLKLFTPGCSFRHVRLFLMTDATQTPK